MPLTPEQIAQLAPRLGMAYNVADHPEKIIRDARNYDEVLNALGRAAFQLIQEQYGTETLELLVRAFPAYPFLQVFTVEDLPPLAKEVRRAYNADKKRAKRERVKRRGKAKKYENLAAASTAS
ncbi:MAG TPA: hypothetical protein DCX25_00855 [Candidatus Pacebacteria bacterium]|nr:MAG: hypothetical protein UX00_C0015G0029 [Microgenomates group bacterium GW2011_GWB1_45_17]KKU22783.1 MAG: hypothetical protein UX35_C0016G0027 [Microgenomates group bacterium GW2011_GWA1_46_15]KKU24046.1 MAG: hypothetical protein UX36_C0002G0029 [Microgenomates group bacterium GW2011_GWC1_46_15]HAV14864.1 hypothetical protein [Candidatus Paceibacterota bacterium]HCR11255.1 hypothetical protein [Candidatus Paceibacterota bacterium]